MAKRQGKQWGNSSRLRPGKSQEMVTLRVDRPAQFLIVASVDGALPTSASLEVRASLGIVRGLLADRERIFPPCLVYGQSVTITAKIPAAAAAPGTSRQVAIAAVPMTTCEEVTTPVDEGEWKFDTEGNDKGE